MVKQSEGCRQLKPNALLLRPQASADDLQLLIKDAIRVEPKRYGAQLQITELGAQIQNLLTIYTKLMTCNRRRETLNQQQGVTGLVLLILTTVLDVRLLIRRR